MSHAHIHTQVAARSLIGRRHRSNDDRAVVLDSSVSVVQRAARGQLFAVIDGVGGVRCGGRAADHMAERLSDFFRDPGLEPNVEGLCCLLQAIDREIRDFGRDSRTGRRLGAAAATVAWLAPDRRLITAHAGDTMALRWDRMGLRRLTEDHGTDRGLSRYVGMGRADLFVVEEQPFEPGDVLCLLSDGVSAVMETHEVGAALAENRPPEDTANLLLREVRARHSMDDATILLVSLEDW